MSVDEGARFRLFESAQRQLGHDAAVTLMEMLPPVEWTEVATKRDVALLGSELRAEMAELRGDFGELRGELKAEIADRSSSTVRTLVLAMVANNAAIFAVAFAAVRLGS